MAVGGFCAVVAEPWVTAFTPSDACTFPPTFLERKSASYGAKNTVYKKKFISVAEILLVQVHVCKADDIIGHGLFSLIKTVSVSLVP